MLIGPKNPGFLRAGLPNLIVTLVTWQKSGTWGVLKDEIPLSLIFLIRNV